MLSKLGCIAAALPFFRSTRGLFTAVFVTSPARDVAARRVTFSAMAQSERHHTFRDAVWSLMKGIAPVK